MNRESLIGGLRGFVISTACVSTPLIILYFYSDSLAALHDIADDENWLGSIFRDQIIATAKGSTAILGVYWFVVALVGKGRVDSIKLANWFLITSFLLLFGVFAIFLLPILPQFDSVCDQLPYPGEYSISDLDKCPMSAIVVQIVQTIFFILIVSSAIVRTLHSRRKYHSET